MYERVVDMTESIRAFRIDFSFDIGTCCYLFIVFVLSTSLLLTKKQDGNSQMLKSKLQNITPPYVHLLHTVCDFKPWSLSKPYQVLLFQYLNLIKQQVQMKLKIETN